MIIFGWDFRKVKNFGPVKRTKCDHCNNESTWQLQKLSTWFTLFAIPIIPYRINYLLVCPICRRCEEIDRSEFEEFLDLINSEKEVDSEQLSSRPDNLITESGVICRTETQLNFIRQMKEIEMEREKRNSLNE